MLVPPGYDLKALERIGDLGAVTSHFNLFSSPLPFLKWESTAPYIRDKGIMPLKQGYADDWATRPFLVGLPLRDEPMTTYRRGDFVKSHRCWAHAPDVTIRLFRYPQAPHFILLYTST
ncbi:hypothetical protein BKP57_10200 [Virgibacillus sp. 6R]|nr:hypothetical protein BKP57_10200 [Virgibacillus sp. 6R]